jgi:hypothetical protein
MANNRGSSGSNQGGGSSDRGFAGMDDQQQREIARKGGESSADSQTRDEQGQFKGSRGSGGSQSGGGSQSRGGSSNSGGSGGSGSSGGSGGSNR